MERNIQFGHDTTQAEALQLKFPEKSLDQKNRLSKVAMIDFDFD
jgi:hypothetical protein